MRNEEALALFIFTDTLPKIWTVKPLPVEKSLNFLPPRCILHNLVYPGANNEHLIITGNSLNFTPTSFGITSTRSLRQSLMSARVSLGPQKSVVTISPKYRDKFLGYDRLNLIHF